MAETISRALTCGECGTDLVKKPGGGKPQYCPACIAERRRIAARDYQRRRRAGRTVEKAQPERYPCSECPGEVVWSRRGTRPERCPACRQEHLDRYQARYRAERGHRPVGATITVTCDCGNSFEHTVVQGRVAWKCRPCLDASYAIKKKHDAEVSRLRAPKPDLRRCCADCGANFLQAHTRGAKVTRCRPCAQARAERLKRAYWKALSSAVSKATQVTFEVVGRWSACLGCGARLTCERMGLVRKWCEKCLPGRKRKVLSAWKLANPDAWRAIVYRANQVRRSRLANVLSEPYDRFEIFERDKWVCQLCKKRIGKRFTGRHPRAASIDHQIPLELGGPDTPANVTAAHFGCNSAKRSRYMPKGEQLALIG